ncbi:hypothetical protein BJ170DRAFT_591967 [Xylariales sp. AK1849]|nr:hypothetical protein BJ170DRAFT_591967 [Xylariales sp. AK1849]
MSGFAKFPTELRLMVWKEFLLQEARNRIIILDQECTTPYALPFADLVSPLLSVNQQTRQQAKRFYSCRLPVYKVPRIDPDRLDSYVTEYLKSHPPLIGYLYHATQQACVEQIYQVLLAPELYASKHGVVHLNLEHDLFATRMGRYLHYKFFVKQWDVRKRAIWEADTRTNKMAREGAPTPYACEHRYVVPSLSVEDCRHIRRLLVADKAGDTIWDFENISEAATLNESMYATDADNLWEAKQFPNCTERLRLATCNYSEEEFLFERQNNPVEVLQCPFVRRWVLPSAAYRESEERRLLSEKLEALDCPVPEIERLSLS